MSEIYHVYNKSIAGFVIFNEVREYSRMLKGIRYYKHEKRLGRFAKLSGNELKLMEKENKAALLVQIVAYCLMPTHLHLILREFKQGGVSEFMRNLLNSYTKFFNMRHKRKGPLWESRSKKVLVKTDEQFLHLTRYLHLNPVTAGLVEKPENWFFSSYGEYIDKTSNQEKICEFSGLVDISIPQYKKFVNDRISYQKELARIKKLILE